MVGVCQFVVFYARHTAIMKYSCSWSPCRTNITSKILPPRISDGSWGAIYSSEITVDQESNRFTLWKNDHILWSHSFFLKQWKLFAYFYQNWLSCKVHCGQGENDWCQVFTNGSNLSKFFWCHPPVVKSFALLPALPCMSGWKMESGGKGLGEAGRGWYCPAALQGLLWSRCWCCMVQFVVDAIWRGNVTHAPSS